MSHFAGGAVGKWWTLLVTLLAKFINKENEVFLRKGYH